MKAYSPILSASCNVKGVLDVDTVKGCTAGMDTYPEGGCYGVCYANRLARAFGYDFSTAVTRKPQHCSFAALPFDSIASSLSRYEPMTDIVDQRTETTVAHHSASWFRIGTMGDPSHDWGWTVDVAEWLGEFKVPVIVTKHWACLSDTQVERIAHIGGIVNTSISALDTEQEVEFRLGQFRRLKDAGVGSVLRIVSCNFGDTRFGKERRRVQEQLFAEWPVIDNPLRIPASDERVRAGDIVVCRMQDLGGGSTVSVAYDRAYVGPCHDCPDQCGVTFYQGGRCAV